MPNWVKNELKIEGQKDDIKSFVEMMGKTFDYNKIIPMPKELEDVSSPVNLISERSYKKQMEEIERLKQSNDEAAKMTLELVRLDITTRMSISYKKRYGFDNWYDWALENWGVKWNVFSSQCQLEYEENSNYCIYSFLSPWSTPYKLFKKLKEQYSNLEFNLFYQDEEGFQGSL